MTSSQHYQLAQRFLKSLNSTRVLPLTVDNVKNAILETPQDFHSQLCRSIQSAKDRVSLASLYIGTGASKEEAELLACLNETSVPTQILMDANRGLRPVKTSTGQITSSAAAVPGPTRLYQTLRQPFKTIMPSPLDEVMGVFHIKAYIVDDTLTLSGANLSQEYFTDRQDRYIQFRGGEMVSFYNTMIDILNDGAQEYSEKNKAPSYKGAAELTASLSNLFAPLSAGENVSQADDAFIVAHAIPTLAHPSLSLPFTSDTQQLTNMLQVSADQRCSVRLASAYLNPTPSMLQSLSKHEDGACTLLTAGPISHGFAPKPGVKRRGDFVPKFFAAQSQTLAEHHKVLWYERPGWTFHAKGLWIVSPEGNLVAAVVGSGNYGYRSESRDLESNCILVFPHETSTLQEELMEEWERLCEFAHEPKFEEPPKTHVRAMWPLIQSYF